MTLYNFSHFMQIWLFPPGLILLLMLISFFLLRLNNKMGKRVMIFAFLSFWFLSTPFITQLLINGLQNQYSPLQFTAYNSPREHSAIVVLGSGIENAKEYEHKHTISDRTLSRLRYTAYLHTKTHLPIIVSGGNRDNCAHTEADLMLAVLKEDYKIAAEWRENYSRNTADEGRFLLPILKQHGIKTIYLVTHAWHMPRSMYALNQAFKQEGIRIVPAPMGYILLKSDDWFSNCLPTLTALNSSAFALHEYVGILWYRLRQNVFI